MKARPTEYRGICFRSKSEARLALLFDHLKLHWFYEPKSLTLDNGYVPDFAILDLYVYDRDEDVQLNASTLPELKIIEYKPSRPTNTYIVELEARFSEIANRIVFKDTGFFSGFMCAPLVSFSLVVGGMGFHEAEILDFDWDPRNNTIHRLSKWRDSWVGIFNEYTDSVELNKKLSGYRFDLA